MQPVHFEKPHCQSQRSSSISSHFCVKMRLPGGWEIPPDFPIVVAIMLRFYHSARFRFNKICHLLPCLRYLQSTLSRIRELSGVTLSMVITSLHSGSILVHSHKSTCPQIVKCQNCNSPNFLHFTGLLSIQKPFYPRIYQCLSDREFGYRRNLVNAKTLRKPGHRWGNSYDINKNGGDGWFVLYSGKALTFTLLNRYGFDLHTTDQWTVL